MPSIVELQNISKSYGSGDGLTQVLDKLNFQVKQNEFLCLWGTSGSGKSTLLNLMGILDQPNEGEVFINGEQISRMNDDTRSRYRNQVIGFVFQSFNLVPVLSTLENVMMTLHIRGISDREAQDRSRAMLSLVGLEKHVHKRPDQISGGQRQRVAIARALVGQPLLVLADEPTANLDTATGQQIIEVMKQASEEQAVTFVFSTHDPALLQYATRNVHLVDGHIVNSPEPASMGQKSIQMGGTT